MNLLFPDWTQVNEVAFAEDRLADGGAAAVPSGLPWAVLETFAPSDRCENSLRCRFAGCRGTCGAPECA